MHYTKPTIFDLNVSARALGFDPWSCGVGNGASGLDCGTGNGAKVACITGNSFKISSGTCSNGSVALETYGCQSGGTATGQNCLVGSSAGSFCVSGGGGRADDCNAGPSFII